MKLRFLGIGILFTLAVLACSFRAPAAPTVFPVEQTPRSPATATQAIPTLTPDASLLTPDTSPPVTIAISPETASQVKLLATLHNDTLTEISQLTWRPDGKALLVDSGGTLTLMETGTWNPLWSIPSVYARVRFTPDGGELLAVRGDEVQRRNAATGELLSSHPIAPEGLFAVSPDGRLLASTLGGGFTLVDVASGEVLRTLPADLNSGPTADLAFSTDGSKIVAGSQNGDLQAWDAQSGQRTLFRPAVIPSPIYECEVNGAMAGQPDGALLVICSYPSNDYSLAYYQVGVFPATTTAQGSSTVIRDMDMRGYSGFTVNADRSRLAVFGGQDLEIWSAFGGSRLLTIPGATGSGMAFNPSEKRLLAVWSKRSIQIWDTSSGQKVDEWQRGGSDSPPVALAFSPLPDSRLLAVGRADGQLELWDTSKAQKQAAWQSKQPIAALAFSPDGRWLAVGADRDKDAYSIFIFSPAANSLMPEFIIRSPAQVKGLAFSADSRLLYSVGYFSDAVTAWEVGSQTVAASWSPGTAYLLDLAARGDTLAVVSEAGQITAWENPPSNASQTIKLSYAWGRLLALSPDGKQVLIQYGYELDIWSFASGQWLRGWAFKSGAPYLAYSPDGCTLAISAGKELSLLDTLRGEFYKSFSGQKTSLVKSPPAFSADGLLLAAAFDDGRIGVWGLESGLESSAGALPPVRCGSFSPLPTPTPTAIPSRTPIPSATPTRTATPIVTATFTPTPPPFVRTLYLTDPPMRGEDVLLLQERLQELGYIEVGVPDGIFGKMTDSAVRRFQEKNALEVDGYVGLKTWQKLFSAEVISG
jgi:WD40 repeat protein